MSGNAPSEPGKIAIPTNDETPTRMPVDTAVFQWPRSKGHNRRRTRYGLTQIASAKKQAARVQFCRRIAHSQRATRPAAIPVSDPRSSVERNPAVSPKRRNQATNLWLLEY